MTCQDGLEDKVGEYIKDPKLISNLGTMAQFVNVIG